MQKVVEIKAMLRGSPAASETPSSSAAIESEPESLEERMDGWRRRCNKAAFRLSKVLHCDVRDVHAKFKQQRTMTEDELKSKYRAIVNQIARRSR